MPMTPTTRSVLLLVVLCCVAVSARLEERASTRRWRSTMDHRPNKGKEPCTKGGAANCRKVCADEEGAGGHCNPQGECICSGRLKSTISKAPTGSTAPAAATASAASTAKTPTIKTTANPTTITAAGTTETTMKETPITEASPGESTGEAQQSFRDKPESEIATDVTDTTEAGDAKEASESSDANVSAEAVEPTEVPTSK